MRSLPNFATVKGIRSLVSGLLFVFLAIFSGQAQSLPAFPGAKGFGSTTAGGRGGAVLFVTNLNDNGTGSLRSACLASGPRIVIFRVTGTIFLQTAIVVENPFLTIAGQTAPGGGICIANEALRIKTHDVIIRGFRSRAGDNTGFQHPLEIEAMHLIGDDDDNQVYNVIADHCSFSWGIDKNIGCWAATFGEAHHDITIQWCISSEALHSRFHPSSDVHAMGMFFASVQRATAHHNLLAHNHARQPQYSRYTWGEGINNVVYNYGTFATEIQSGAKVALIGNYYKTGVDWTGVFPGINVDDLEPGYPASSVYVLGNVGPGRLTDTGDQWNAVNGNETFRSFVPPFTLSGVVSTSATDAYDQVLDGAGAFPRDAVDVRIIGDVINTTGEHINSQDDVGGWPVLAPGTAPIDSDNDGMPNTWETANGLNPNLADGNGDQDGDGYTNVEEYVNSLIITGGPIGDPPVVSDIPNQTISTTGRFTAIRVDDYVADPDNGDSEITWTWSGNTDLTVTWDGARRGFSVRRPTSWTGNETIIFTATDPDGNTDSDAASFTAGTLKLGDGGGEEAVEHSGTIAAPATTDLLGNYPNPFNPSTTIRYAVAEETWVTLRVYNMLGQEVATLVNELRAAGYHSATWNGTTDAGGSAASGVYVYRLNAGDFVTNGRMLLAK